MDNNNDRALVRRVLKGEVQLFAKIVERYERPVYNLMYRYCRSEQDAADLSQDVFLRIYDRLASFNGDKKFFPWVYALAINIANDWYRSNSLKRQKMAELQWQIPDVGAGSEQERILIDQEVAGDLYRALDELSDASREMVVLRYRYELNFSEIAYIFNASEGAVKMKISRGLAKMKTILGGDIHE